MKFIKTFETYFDAFYELTSKDPTEVKSEFRNLMRRIGKPSSEDGKNYSDAERKELHALVKRLEPELYNKPDISPEREKSNYLIRLKSEAETLLKIVRKTMNDSSYQAKNPSQIEILKFDINALIKAKKGSDPDLIKTCISNLQRSLVESRFEYNLWH